MSLKVYIKNIKVLIFGFLFLRNQKKKTIFRKQLSYFPRMGIAD